MPRSERTQTGASPEKGRAVHIILPVLIALCMLTGGFAAYKAVTLKNAQDREQAAFASIAEDVSHKKQELRSAPGGISSEDEVIPWYEALYLRNSDLYGWLSIPGTVINYPVMHTPDDPEYYLRRDFDRNSATCGTLFLDGDCDPKGSFLLVYGHRMKNGTMFGTLTDFETKSFCEAHPLFTFDTLHEERTYEVCAAFYSRVLKTNEEGFRYYAYTELPDEETFNEFIGGVSERMLYDTGIRPVYGDELLVLSTCSYHTDDGRFVVVARRVE